ARRRRVRNQPGPRGGCGPRCAAVVKDWPMANRYAESEALLDRARRVVPGGVYGHQSPRMVVGAAYPYFFARGDGCRVWDVDGNEFIDLMCSYGPIVLGHQHP